MFLLSRKIKVFTLVTIDSLLIMIANFFAYLYMGPFVRITQEMMVNALILQLCLYLIFGFFFKVFVRINRYTNLKEMIAIFLTIILSYLIESIYFFMNHDRYSQRYILLTSLIALLLIIISRITWRLIVEYDVKRRNVDPKSHRILLVGAGAGASMLLNTLKNSTKSQGEIVGVVDDDRNKQGTVFCGQKVLGTIQDLPHLIEEKQADMITVAIPSLPAKQYEEILDLVKDKKVKINTVPSLEEIVHGDVSVSKLREVDVVDLLGREEVQLDMDTLAAQLTNKVILVTGAGGSIGSEICRQLMRFTPKKLLLVGHGENSIYLIEKELRNKFSNKNTEIIPIIADVQDRKRMFELMEKYHPAIVYHAAAHKHVPMMEYNPTEAIKNNIYGTKNVAEAAKDADVKSFVMVSTDKANNPPNVMGATKRVAEMIVTGLNEEGKTKFSATRFGNVLGSRGSVVPLFKEQIAAGGPVTVTDMRMTRYFMTIPEASRLVIQSGVLAKGGEVFILDMGEPVKISDLAKKIIKLSGFSEDEIPVVETGIRPGEKLYEELLVDKEKSPEQIYDKIFVGNVSAYQLGDVMDFVENLSKDEEELSKEIVAYANQSSKE
ncbi:polysaccharide biosynthesis protein [Vagococcus sp. PNs007]|uniref:Polysaccharide biosynthesis protein n=1 Tax=Vagococcus proximus TaxID=2991417 RepID=A0ABT5WZZ9_9ENTE|nr:nucleoside-diphosphate sugar epimerase/dehydratase [Vagococcus proximus]MDF0479332.1 polysaccharide biosynthesis protein [Vagococcus proximus]